MDLAGTLPGRGAYLCRGDAPGRPAAECLERATRRGGIARTLRRSVALELDGAAAAGPAACLQGTPNS